MDEAAQFKSLLNKAFVAPIVFMGMLAALLCWQIVALLDLTQWVDHTDEVIAQANLSLKLMIDAETGQRGYLVGGSKVFLQPYNEAQQQIDGALNHLATLVKDNPGQTARVEQIRRGYAVWLDEAHDELALLENGRPYRSYFNQARGKALMDSERERFAEFLRSEIDMKARRSVVAQQSGRAALLFAVCASLLFGVLLALQTRRRLYEIRRVYVHALTEERSARAVTEAARQEIVAKSAEVESLNADLERRVAERTSELEASNRELEAFSYSVSHDLRAPLRSIDGFSVALLEDYGDTVDEMGKNYLRRIRANSQNMGRLIDGLLNLSRLTRSEMRQEKVDLSDLARECMANLRQEHPDRQVEFIAADEAIVQGDTVLLRNIVQNLLGNAWKFTAKKPDARVEFGVMEQGGETVYFVRDNGAGFDMAYAPKLFGAFQRLHGATEYEGTGIGLATVQRVIRRHGGRVWAEGKVNQGATFYFTLPSPRERT